MSHERASNILEEIRRPRDVKKKLPMIVRSIFSRLRSGHVTKLKAYRKRIGLYLVTYDFCCLQLGSFIKILNRGNQIPTLLKSVRTGGIITTKPG